MYKFTFLITMVNPLGQSITRPNLFKCKAVTITEAKEKLHKFIRDNKLDWEDRSIFLEEVEVLDV